MKMEVMMRRSNFRDYYDIYSIVRYGIDIHELVSMALSYSGHRMKSKNLYAMLSNGQRFSVDERFLQLSPIYNETAVDIESYLKSKIQREMKN